MGLSIALAPLWAGCQSGAYSTTSTPQTRVQFQCDNGEEVEMRFFPVQGVGVLVRGGKTLELQQHPSASGFIYSNGPDTVRGKGSELTIEVGRMVPIRCRAH
jgi:membrane-bound inhibitor of C-type lysozyme